MKRIKYRKLDESGALEGLPLYMIILVVIAGVGTAVIGGWMMSAQSTELGSIEVEEGDKTITEGYGKDVTITAYDQDNNGLSGVVVKLEGCDVVESKETNSDGTVTFEDVDPNLPENENFGEIEVTATYTGEMETTKHATITVKSS